MVKSIRSRCHIGITILIAVLCGMLLLGVPCLRQSRRNPAPFLQLANTSSPDSLAQFGRMAGWKHGDIVVYSLADSNFREEMLQQFHAAQTFGFQYAVLCIDDSCMATCRSRMLLCYDGFVGRSVGSIKFSSNVELLELGFHTVLADLDAFILSNPFDHMRPLSDPGWHLQVQRDALPPSFDLNLGWVFTRACPNTVKYWRLAGANWAAAEQDWDQAVWQKAVFEGEEAGELSVHRLPLDQFRSFELEDFQHLYASADPALLGPTAALFHLTCVDPFLKQHIARLFGLLQDPSLCAQRATFSTVDGVWSGSRAELLLQTELVLAFGKKSGRAFVPPKFANVSDTSFNEVPFFRLIDLGSANSTQASVSKALCRVINLRFAFRPGMQILEFDYLDIKRRHCHLPADDAIVNPQSLSEAESSTSAHMVVDPAMLTGMRRPEASLRLCPIIASRANEYRENPVCWLCKSA